MEQWKDIGDWLTCARFHCCWICMLQRWNEDNDEIVDDVDDNDGCGSGKNDVTSEM